MRASGESHNVADMLAHQRSPQLNTDVAFLAERENGRQFERNPAIGDLYRSEAEANGCSVTGKIYVSQLADYPGDPRAWVSSRGDAKRLLEERGWECDGLVKTPGVEKDHGPGVGVDPELLEDCTVEACLNDPALNERVMKGQWEEVKAEVFEKVAPEWAKT